MNNCINTIIKKRCRNSICRMGSLKNRKLKPRKHLRKWMSLSGSVINQFKFQPVHNSYIRCFSHTHSAAKTNNLRNCQPSNIITLRMSPWWSWYVRCIHRMPGGVIVGDSGICCCGPAFSVMCDVNCSSAMTSHCLRSCTCFSARLIYASLILSALCIHLTIMWG